MTPTVAVEDRVIYDRAAYATAAPERGDVILFRPPPSAVRTCGGNGLFVKRVAGVGGDVIRTTGREVIVNGAPVATVGARPTDVTRRFPAVPAGRVLVFGDNGLGSCDSARWPNPFVPVSNIVGRVDGIVWPRRRAGLLPGGGGLDRLDPSGVERDRMDALIEIGRGAARADEAFTGPRVCSVVTPRDCVLQIRVDAALAARDERRALGALLPSLQADCAGTPIRTLRRALGLDVRAALSRPIGLRRLAQRLRVHNGAAVTALAACWQPSPPGTPPLG